jgi:type II secretory pathway pseudopilin PulG
MVTHFAPGSGGRPLWRRCAGFTYIGLMLSLAIGMTGLASASVSWHTAVQRSQEAQLIFIGTEFKAAIKSFYDATPGAAKQLPRRLEDLLLDTRYPTVRRHLRKIYVDPLTGRAEWGLVATPAGITGVYSLSPREPFKNRGTPPAAKSNTAPAADPLAQGGAGPAPRPKEKYSDCKFVASLSQAQESSPAPRAPGVLQAPATPAPSPEVVPVPTVSPAPMEAAPR